MIHKRLMHIMGKSKKYVWSQVFFQWFSLLCNIVLMSGISLFLGQLSAGSTSGLWKNALWILLPALAIRYVCTVLASRVSHYAAKQVKERLRTMIYEKLLRLGLGYQQKARTSEVVQLAVEGVDQLEVYFGSYLPQLCYSLLAPLTLFAVLSFVSLPCAVIFIPLCPADPHYHRGRTAFCQEASGEILGGVHLPGRFFSGKPAGTDNPQNLSGGCLPASDDE